MRKRGGWSVIVFLAISILLSVFCIPIMYVLDRHLLLLQEIPHNISGEIWFPIISDFILTIPANAICVFALWQTWYYHKLDEERLYPEVCMESAVLETQLVDWDGFETWAAGQRDFTQEWLDKLQDYRHKHKIESDMETPSNLGLLRLKAKLLLKEGESICRMEMEDIAIRIGAREYKMKFEEKSRKFVTNYKNGQEKYQIDWELDFDDMGVLPKSKTNSREDFWNDMYEVLFDGDCDVTKRNMTWMVDMKINYGVNETKRKRTTLDVKWRILWDWGKRKKLNDYAMKCKTKNGMFKVA